jgi:hypothetical protein
LVQARQTLSTDPMADIVADIEEIQRNTVFAFLRPT